MDSKLLSKVSMSVSRSRNSGGRVRYSKFVKETVSAWLESGQSPASVAARTGIRPQTIGRWFEKPEAAFRRLEVKPVGAQDLTVRFASGVRIVSPSVDLMIATLEFFK